MVSIVAAHETHTILVLLGFQSGETSSIPGTCVPPAHERFSAQWPSAFLKKGTVHLNGTASEELG